MATAKTEKPLDPEEAEALRCAVANAQQMVRFHVDRGDRFRQRAERAEAELARLKKGTR